jgi:hypothetical protein
MHENARARIGPGVVWVELGKDRKMTTEAAESVFTAVVIYAAFLAVVLVGVWVYGVVSDRLHARRMVARFDLFVASLDRSSGGSDD